jgi:hypothetical protein
MVECKYCGERTAAYTDASRLPMWLLFIAGICLVGALAGYEVLWIPTFTCFAFGGLGGLLSRGRYKCMRCGRIWVD